MVPWRGLTLQNISIGAALRDAPMVVDACSGVVAVLVAAADETSHAEARPAKPSQASQSRDRLTNRIGYVCDCGSVTRHRAWLITNILYQISPMT